MRTRRAVMFYAIVIASFGCSVGLLDLEGKACPCADGYVCKEPENVCVLPSTAAFDGPNFETDAGAETDGARPDAASRIQVSALTSPWQTANTIRWDWQVDGDSAAFQAYKIEWADSAEKLERGITQSFGGADKPELAAFRPWDGNTSGPFKMWTTTQGHGVNTKYFARVTVTEASGATSTTAVASAKTTSLVAAPNVRVLFDGSKPVTATPSTFTYRTGGGIEPHYRFVAECDANRCDVNLQLTGLGTSLTPFTQENFDAAFLEVRLSITSTASTGFDSVISVIPPGCPRDSSCGWTFSGWSQRWGENRPPLQVPLRELDTPTGKLTFAQIQTSGFAVAGISIAGSWAGGALFRLFDARIKW